MAPPSLNASSPVGAAWRNADGSYWLAFVSVLTIAAVSPWKQKPCYTQKTAYHRAPYHSLPLFPPSVSPALGGRVRWGVDMDVPFGAKQSPVTNSQNLDQLKSPYIHMLPTSEVKDFLSYLNHNALLELQWDEHVFTSPRRHCHLPSAHSSLLLGLKACRYERLLMVATHTGACPSGNLPYLRGTTWINYWEEPNRNELHRTGTSQAPVYGSICSSVMEDS